MSVLSSAVSPRSDAFRANRAANLEALETVRTAAGLAMAGGGDKAEPASPGAPVPAGGGRIFGAPAGAAPTIGGGVSGGSRPPGAAPPADAGARFPANVMPTPLRPYASSAGGGR